MNSNRDKSNINNQKAPEWIPCFADRGNPAELTECYITRHDGSVVESIYSPTSNSYTNCGAFWPKAWMPRCPMPEPYVKP